MKRMIKKGKLWICDRCGRTQFQEQYPVNTALISNSSIVYRPMKQEWYSGTHDLCPTCAALVENARKSIIAGKSVNIPALEK